MKYFIFILLFGACSPIDPIQAERTDATLIKIDTVWRGTEQKLICTWYFKQERLEIVTFENIPFYIARGTHIPYLKIK